MEQNKFFIYAMIQTYVHEINKLQSMIFSKIYIVENMRNKLFILYEE